MELELLSWICVIGIAAAGVMNLRLSPSTLIARQDFREWASKEQGDRYQRVLGVVYLAASAIAALTLLLAGEGSYFFYGMLAAVAVLVVGSVLCSRKFLRRDADK